ncbi:MAG: DUF115 domain-containing protein [Treponema sp.]|jgi:hypothetical protein|nr:DUF115 domain-containing protein [Treponema sp.]
MSPDHWEENFPVIREKYPRLAEELGVHHARSAFSGAEDLDIRIETGPAGVGLIINGLHIHSPRDPVRESRRMIEAASQAEDSDPEGPLIFLGFGLGYAVEAAREKWPLRPFIVLERRKRVLKTALEVRDLRRIFQTGPLIIVLGEDTDSGADGGADGGAITGALRLAEKLSGEKTGKPVLIRNRGLMSLDEAWYAEMERRIDAWSSKNEVNAATLRRFGKRWVRNLGKNMDAIRDLPGISSLRGILDGEIPVFLAAAGPSLEEAGPLLEEIAQRCLIVAVDTSLRFLLKRGIDPDFAVVVDPQYWNARHLDRAPAPKTALIAESAVYPPVLNHPFARRFLCGSLFPLGRFIEDRVDAKGELGAGGSVATTAWDFACQLGASSLWISGLDLSFPGLKTHFKGALFEERALGEATRFVPAETRSVRALRDGRPFMAPAARGGNVLTDRRLSLYAAWFENRFSLNPALPNYSLSPKGVEGGLAIPGLIPTDPEAILALPLRREEINSRLNRAFAAAREEFARAPERAARYEEARRALLEGMERLRSLAESAARAAEEALRRTDRMSAGGVEAVLSQLDRINRLISGSEVKDVAGFLFPPIRELEQGLPSGGTDPYGRHLELCARLYRALVQAADYHLSILGNKKQRQFSGNRAKGSKNQADKVRRGGGI